MSGNYIHQRHSHHSDSDNDFDTTHPTVGPSSTSARSRDRLLDDMSDRQYSQSQNVINHSGSRFSPSLTPPYPSELPELSPFAMRASDLYGGGNQDLFEGPEHGRQLRSEFFGRDGRVERYDHPDYRRPQSDRLPRRDRREEVDREEQRRAREEQQRVDCEEQRRAAREERRRAALEERQRAAREEQRRAAHEARRRAAREEQQRIDEHAYHESERRRRRRHDERR